jgi:two-component system sensor histidine kinase FlrB
VTISRKINQRIRSGAELAHQLRNPLTALILQLEEIAEKTNQVEIFSTAQQALNSLNRIQDLAERSLKIWRVSIEHELSEISILKIVEEVKNFWDKKFLEFNRELRISGPTNLYVLGALGIESATLSVLDENSLQYGFGPTSIEISEDINFVYFKIFDQGQGINKSIQQDVMKHGVTTSGNGIGLAWAQNHVLKIGGNLELISMQPAVFKVSLLKSSITF